MEQKLDEASEYLGEDASKIDESDLEDEYRDMVVDMEQSRQLVKMADDFLEGKDDEPLLALPAPGDDEDETKSLGGYS